MGEVKDRTRWCFAAQRVSQRDGTLLLVPWVGGGELERRKRAVRRWG